MWTDNGRLIPNNLKYETKFERKSSVTQLTSERISGDSNNVDFNITTEDDMEFCDIIGRNICDTNTVEKEVVVHVTNTDANKTVINESSETKQRIISLKIEKGNEFPHISEMKSQLYTKTAMLLQITLSQVKELINKFDTQRAKLKHNSGHNQSLIDDYMDLIAQIEVKLINKEMDLKEEVGRLGREQWEKDDSLNLIPKEATKRKYYDDIITNLKRIKILRNKLNI